MRNAPRGNDLETARYLRPYYKEWSQRIDGALGQAFAELTKSQDVVLAKGEVPMDGPLSVDYFNTLSGASGEVFRICGKV